MDFAEARRRSLLFAVLRLPGKPEAQSSFRSSVPSFGSNSSKVERVARFCPEMDGGDPSLFVLIVPAEDASQGLQWTVGNVESRLVGRVLLLLWPLTQVGSKRGHEQA
jgi:hypothetical protein